VRKIAAAAAAIPYIAYICVAALFRRIWPGGADEAQTGRRSRVESARDLRAESFKDSNFHSGKDSAAGLVRGSTVGSVRGLSGGSIRGQSAWPVRGTDAAPLRAGASKPVRGMDAAPVPDAGNAPIFPPGAGRGRALTVGVAQVFTMGVAVALVVGGLLLGLPAKQAADGIPVTFAPIAPQEGTGRSQGDLPLDVGFELKFTKPMNEASVANALTITPQVGVNLQWDATGRTVALVPNPHWDPTTNYVVTVGGTATDQQGLGLASEINAQFKSGSLTSGDLIATDMIGNLASPGTTFQLTFSRPVKLLMVQTHLFVNGVAVCPPISGVSAPPVDGTCAAVNGVSPTPVCPTVDAAAPAPINGACPNQTLDIVGDDPTDIASQVFTATPQTQLASKAAYVASFPIGQGSTAATDAAGAALQPIQPLQITTLSAPAVVKFRPQDGSVTYDTNQPISVRFTTAMETRSTAAAFSVSVDGVAIAGGKSWAEGNTVLILAPRHSFTVGSTVVAKVTSAARAVGGLHLSTTYTTTFKISKKPASVIGYGGAKTKKSPWYASEVYYWRLMNCTRTGGWVTSNGSCSSVTHHTLPAQNALRLSAAISTSVSRPYAAYMADNGLLSHYLRGTNPHGRMCKAGFCGGGWGENIASPRSVGKGGMISIEIFYQNEFWCRCEHYGNIMNRYFSQAGIGVWFSKSVRVAIDFYQ
jgi:hypothetical protein